MSAVLNLIILMRLLSKQGIQNAAWVSYDLMSLEYFLGIKFFYLLLVKREQCICTYVSSSIILFVALNALSFQCNAVLCGLGVMGH